MHSAGGVSLVHAVAEGVDAGGGTTAMGLGVWEKLRRFPKCHVDVMRGCVPPAHAVAEGVDAGCGLLFPEI
jgi:hypothetical protein